MQRRKFLTTTLATAATSVAITAPTRSSTSKSFVVKNTKSRFDEATKLAGISPNDIKVSSKDTDGQLSIFEYIGNAKGGPPLHIHLYQDEIFFVQEGKYKFQVSDETHYLEKGDTIFLPRNVPHAFAQLSELGKLLFFFSPSGKMEDYFRELSKFKAPPSPQEGAKVFADHDMKVVGPPLSLD